MESKECTLRFQVFHRTAQNLKLQGGVISGDYILIVKAKLPCVHPSRYVFQFSLKGIWVPAQKNIQQIIFSPP